MVLSAVDAEGDGGAETANSCHRHEKQRPRHFSKILSLFVTLSFSVSEEGNTTRAKSPKSGSSRVRRPSSPLLRRQPKPFSWPFLWPNRTKESLAPSLRRRAKLGRKVALSFLFCNRQIHSLLSFFIYFFCPAFGR
jgi:hypothetical protein